MQGSMHRTKNNFQIGIDATRLMMKSQIGVKFTSNTIALSGHWLDDNNKYYDTSYQITHVSYESGNIAGGFSFDDDSTFEFPPVIFMHAKTQVSWNPIPAIVRQQWQAELNTTKHKNSIRRAREFMQAYLVRSSCSPSDIIITLDGNGENRMGMYEVLRESGFPEHEWPTILTFEMDPVTAFANQLMFGSDRIIFTGSDPTFHSKTLLGKGGIMLEHIITKANSILTDDMKGRTKAVYFDYCGGPAGNQAPEKSKRNFEVNIFPMLPNCVLFGVTISYRKHVYLARYGVEGYISYPSRFQLLKTFRENKKVLCQFFGTVDTITMQNTDEKIVKKSTSMPTSLPVGKFYICKGSIKAKTGSMNNLYWKKNDKQNGSYGGPRRKRSPGSLKDPVCLFAMTYVSIVSLSNCCSLIVCTGHIEMVQHTRRCDYGMQRKGQL